ncbi:VOC family protein [Mangrovicella endophytica]|uniref:VOC family protein n=1 Tax=Mangrovicella endophytica TaxID=2066697 RepID=UPI000C9EB2AB|nr:VOC family protein [Mangrovicella endophytica]
MTASLRTLRSVDHVVMPVGSLELARRFFEGLGFLVAPDAQHPFGTRNACVFLADGTYIEPLAIGVREDCEAAIRDGNLFVARDQAFRFRRGEHRFSAVAFASGDAEGDLAAFRAAGLGEGDILSFSRRFERPDGGSGEVSFRLAFAIDRRAPDASFFVCQPVHTVAPDRTPLTGHPNGVTGLKRLVFSEPNPTDFQYLLQDLAGQRDVLADSFGMSLAAANATIEVLTPEGLGARYGCDRSPERGLRFEGIVLAASDAGRLRHALYGSGVGFEEHGGRMIVRLSEHAQSFIAFETEERP